MRCSRCAVNLTESDQICVYCQKATKTNELGFDLLVERGSLVPNAFGWDGSKGAPYSHPLTMEMFNAGVWWWINETNWPKDFHNKLYLWLNELRSHWPDFALWWKEVVPELDRWQAWRVHPGKIPVSEVFLRIRQIETDLQKEVLLLNSRLIDLPTFPLIEWSDVQRLAILAMKIKGVSSPVAASKVCHFFFPAVYPVTDNAALGLPGGNRYDRYFDYFRHCWKRTDLDTQEAMTDALAQLIHERGVDPSRDYPLALKATELSLIGRRNPRRPGRRW